MDRQIMLPRMRRFSRRECLGLIGAGVAALALPASAQSTTSKPTRRPNIVLMLIDDMGWADVGFMGNDLVATPNLDRLATDGVVFTSAYANAPNCAPTRASLMTGQYTPRHGVYTVSDSSNDDPARQKLIPVPTATHLSADSVTIAEALKQAGYATACFGMWNLGQLRDPRHSPTGEGFDVFKAPSDLGFGDPRSYFPAARVAPDGRIKAPAAPQGQYLTDRLTEEAVTFIESNRGRPFFVYLAHHAIHTPHEPKPELLARYRDQADPARAAHAAMVESVDQSMGRIREVLDRLCLTGSTIVIFFSDNGGEAGRGKPGNAPLRDGKGTMYEGGIRVPLVVSVPGRPPAARRIDTPVMGADLYPTILELAAVPAPRGHRLDGLSLVPLLSTHGTAFRRDALFFHFPEYVGRGTPCSAVRCGDHKLIEFFEDGRLELYDLKNDIGETRNLAQEMPAKSTELHRLLVSWRQSLDAPAPSTPNPAYNPAKRRARPPGGCSPAQ